MFSKKRKLLILTDGSVVFFNDLNYKTQLWVRKCENDFRNKNYLEADYLVSKKLERNPVLYRNNFF